MFLFAFKGSKGSGIVVLDREEYVESLEKEIEQSNTYEMTDTNRTEEAHKKVKK